MRILVGADVPPNPDSGAAGTVVATNAALRAIGHEVHEIWDRDLAHRIRHWNLHYLFELPREYRRAVTERCDRNDYDVVQLSQPHAWLAARDHRRRGRHGVFVNRSHGLESMADEALAAWHAHAGIRENHFPRSLLTPAIRSALHRHVDKVVRYCDGMIVPAMDIRERLLERHGAEYRRIAVVHHGVPDEFIETPQAPMDDRRARRMLHVAQYSFIKGPRFVAAAAAIVLAEDARAELTWVCGSGDHAAVCALFPEPVRTRVRLVDWMRQPELLALYDSHGIHLAHSIYEGAAKAATEAMARGQAVVSSRVGALKEHLGEAGRGFLVDVGDTHTMAERVLSLLREPTLVASTGAAAAAYARRLSWRTCAESATDFYRFLIENPLQDQS